MNRDTLIGIVGCAVLVGAMVGVFWSERTTALAAGAGPGDGRVTGIAGPALEGAVAIGETKTELAQIDAATARNLTFTLTWSATNGRDTLKLTIAPPTGSGIPEGGMSEEEDDGEITVTVRVPEGASAAGQWEVKVQFVSAEPDALPGGIPPPDPLPAETDASVDYTVETSAS